jgi:hypothetical protein
VPIRGGRRNPRGTSHPADLCRQTALKGIAGLIAGGFSLFSAPDTTPQPFQTSPMPSLAQEVARRRTFAIIAHPDAGKTTPPE